MILLKASAKINTRNYLIPYSIALSYKACELNDVAYEPDTVFHELIIDMLKEEVYEYAMNYENRQIKIVS